MISTAFAGFHGTGKSCAGAHFANHVQFAWQIGRSHGKSIANRSRERRIIAIRGHLFGKHSPGRFQQTHFLDGAARVTFERFG